MVSVVFHFKRQRGVMSIIVQKYGGSSVATIEKLKSVARKVVEAKGQGHQVVVVVSAMGDSTDHLVELACQLSSNPSRRELDALLATGEMVSASLLAMALHEQGERAVALNGLQCGILTNSAHSNARILEVCPTRIRMHLDRGEIVVVAGFQGFNPSGDFTTLGRGGSDTTAVALAGALNTGQCEIYTDVPGVFTADPRSVAQARSLNEIDAAEMLELAWTGAKVLKAEAVEFASNNGVPIVVRPTFENHHSTWVHPGRDSNQAFRPRGAEVIGVSGRKDVTRIVFSPAELPDAGTGIFRLIVQYDLIQGSADDLTRCDIFISNQEIPDPEAFRAELQDRYGFAIKVFNQLGIVSLVGHGLGSKPVVFFDALNLLRGNGIPVITSFSARESLSYVVPIPRLHESVSLMHAAFVESPGLQDAIFVAAANNGANSKT